MASGESFKVKSIELPVMTFLQNNVHQSRRQIIQETRIQVEKLGDQSLGLLDFSSLAGDLGAAVFVVVGQDELQQPVLLQLLQEPLWPAVKMTQNLHVMRVLHCL